MLLIMEIDISEINKVLKQSSIDMIKCFFKSKLSTALLLIPENK